MPRLAASSRPQSAKLMKTGTGYFVNVLYKSDRPVIAIAELAGSDQTGQGLLFAGLSGPEAGKGDSNGFGGLG